MKKHLLVSLAIIGLTLPGMKSAEALELTVLGGLNLHSPSVDPETAGTENKSGTGAMFGALIGWGLFPGFGMESGALFAKRKMTIEGTGTNLDVSYGTMEVPLMVRFTALPILSVGGGVVYSRNNRKTKQEGTYANNTVNTEEDDIGLKKNEFGLRANARLGIPLVPLASLVVDVNYVLGLTDINLDPNTSTKTREIQILAGASIGF